MEKSDRNRTPDKLTAADREPVFEICDEALRWLVAWCEPERVIGVGSFAAARARDALGAGGRLDSPLRYPPPHACRNRSLEVGCR